MQAFFCKRIYDLYGQRVWLPIGLMTMSLGGGFAGILALAVSWGSEVESSLGWGCGCEVEVDSRKDEVDGQEILPCEGTLPSQAT